MSRNQKPITEAAKVVASVLAPSVPVTVATMAEAGFPEVLTEQESEPDTTPPTPPASDAEDLPVSIDLELFAQHMEALPVELFEKALEVMLAEAHIRNLIGEMEPLALATEQEDEPVADEHASVRELLTRHGLKQAWQDEAGNYHFDEKAAQAAQATTVITAQV
ncbi:hypothetical protein [Hymenobacter sp. YC55]|uniref:hypothetical protein n=1 Tax=Hymenobacter sp. YC55 TaxID=3034019 RepID=UPI0023F82E6E|nr:hypothetical protein [Hymenobacter sp. YC55]MDF7810755.1 hypothetical protein [Hymenobacter sp. YC55]